jgi:hypothetical protein
LAALRVKKEAFIIGKANKTRAFGGKSGRQLRFYSYNNAKTWMTGMLYGKWIKTWDEELLLEDHKMLLLTNIHVENFSANLTPHVQPMYASIIQCFKARYLLQFIQHAIDQYDIGTTPSKIHDINQLEGMILHFQPIVSLLNASRFSYYSVRNDPIQSAERNVKGFLDDLEKNWCASACKSPAAQ